MLPGLNPVLILDSPGDLAQGTVSTLKPFVCKMCMLISWKDLCLVFKCYNVKKKNDMLVWKGRTL